MIPQIHFAGDPYTIGKQHGHQVQHLRPRLLVEIEKSLEALTKIPYELQPVLDEAHEIMHAGAKSTLEMMRGIANSLEIQWKQYFRHTVATFIQNLFQRRLSQDHG